MMIHFTNLLNVLSKETNGQWMLAKNEWLLSLFRIANRLLLILIKRESAHSLAGGWFGAGIDHTVTAPGKYRILISRPFWKAAASYQTELSKQSAGTHASGEIKQRRSQGWATGRGGSKFGVKFRVNWNSGIVGPE